MIHLDLNDDTLFGNADAEDENDDLFMSYAISDKPEVQRFLDYSKPIAIARAYKGEGKSSLLKLTKIKVSSLGTNHIVINSSAPNLSPNLDTDDNDLWVREWKTQIFKLIANEVGTKIGIAYRDDAISLVEEAQNNGFKEKSVIRSIIERLTPPYINPNFKGIDNTQDKGKIIERFLSEKSWNIWLIIDDIDQNFQNTNKNKIKIAAFFTAIRHLTQQLPELRIRATIRPNVWTTLKLEYESLSHLEQYMQDMTWNLDDFYKLFAGRIEGYLKRKNIYDDISFTGTSEIDKREEKIQLIFQNPMPWGQKNKSPISILYTLSRHRPRWGIELAKKAGESAAISGNGKIRYDDIKSKLSDFGLQRIIDAVAEFKSQCPQVEDLLIAFKGQPNKYTTDKLFKTIEKRILQGLQPKIIGVIGTAGAKEVAQFLYQIGFLSARNDISNNEYEHILYAEKPSLLKTSTNLDQGYLWEIHPIFRDALDLKDFLMK